MFPNVSACLLLQIHIWNKISIPYLGKKGCCEKCRSNTFFYVHLFLKSRSIPCHFNNLKLFNGLPCRTVLTIVGREMCLLVAPDTRCCSYNTSQMWQILQTNSCDLNDRVSVTYFYGELIINACRCIGIMAWIPQKTYGVTSATDGMNPSGHHTQYGQQGHSRLDGSHHGRPSLVRHIIRPVVAGISIKILLEWKSACTWITPIFDP